MNHAICAKAANAFACNIRFHTISCHCVGLCYGDTENVFMLEHLSGARCKECKGLGFAFLCAFLWCMAVMCKLRVTGSRCSPSVQHLCRKVLLYNVEAPAQSCHRTSLRAWVSGSWFRVLGVLHDLQCHNNSDSTLTSLRDRTAISTYMPVRPTSATVFLSAAYRGTD